MDRLTDTAALILAAGASRRMGQMKQLLDLGGIPLLERVVCQVMRFPFTEIVTVIGYGFEQIRQRVSIADERFRWIVNADYDRGQSHSLQKGIDEIESSAVMVFLGDQPFIARETTRAIYDEGVKQAAKLNRPFVVRPSFRSVPGHPVYFGNVQQMDFDSLSGDQGAKPLIRKMNHHYVLPVDDDGIVFDIDTPEAYERAKQILERQGGS
mgnify:CR=1 FL=1